MRVFGLPAVFGCATGMMPYYQPLHKYLQPVDQVVNFLQGLKPTIYKNGKHQFLQSFYEPRRGFRNSKGLLLVWYSILTLHCVFFILDFLGYFKTFVGAFFLSKEINFKCLYFKITFCAKISKIAKREVYST